MKTSPIFTKSLTWGIRMFAKDCKREFTVRRFGGIIQDIGIGLNE